MQRILTTVILILFFLCFSTPSEIFSQEYIVCGQGFEFIDGISLSSTTTEPGESVEVSINSSNLSGEYFVVVGPVNTGVNVVPLESTVINVVQGQGSVTVSIPDNTPNDEYTVLIASSINPLQICAGGSAVLTVVGQEVPPDKEDGSGCRNTGESCIEGVTPLCSPDTTYCDMAGGGVAGGGIVRQLGNIGSKCGFNGEVYACTNGVPSTQDEGCECIQEKLKEPAGGTAALIACRGVEGTVNTAIGCIPFNVLGSLASFFLSWGIGIGGGIALFVLSIASFQIALSQGNPEKLANAKSLFMSGIGGLLFLILSIFLLRFIGVNVLSLFS